MIFIFSVAASEYYIIIIIIFVLLNFVLFNIFVETVI